MLFKKFFALVRIKYPSLNSLLLTSNIKPATHKQCWLQYKELFSWVLLVFILILHFKNPFINYPAMALELSMRILSSHIPMQFSEENRKGSYWGDRKGGDRGKTWLWALCADAHNIPLRLYVQISLHPINAQGHFVLFICLVCFKCKVAINIFMVVLQKKERSLNS